MLLLTVAALAAGAALVYWFVFRRGTPSPDARADKIPLRRFGGVEILLKSDACEAARSLAGQRFLAKLAPSLPLPNCGAAQCSCSFAKLADRRTDDRRYEHGGLGAALYNDEDRRAKTDRRAAEKTPKRG